MNSERSSHPLQSFLYLAWYMTMSILGHYNNFFFAAHLLDIAMGFKTLRTILSSVTHNGKQVNHFVQLRASSPPKKPAAAAAAAVCSVVALRLPLCLAAGADGRPAGGGGVPLHCRRLQLLQEVLQQG